MRMLVKHRANVERRVPTAADSRQVDVLRAADRLRRRVKLRSACASRTDRASSSIARSRETLDGPLQLLRLPQYVFQKMRHHAPCTNFLRNCPRSVASKSLRLISRAILQLSAFAQDRDKVLKSWNGVNAWYFEPNTFLTALSGR